MLLKGPPLTHGVGAGAESRGEDRPAPPSCAHLGLPGASLKLAAGLPPAQRSRPQARPPPPPPRALGAEGRVEGYSGWAKGAAGAGGEGKWR